MDGHPVVRAHVLLADLEVGVITDRGGRFCITAPAGERTLTVLALGFSPSRQLVTLRRQTPEIHITLQSATIVEPKP